MLKSIYWSLSLCFDQQWQLIFLTVRRKAQVFQGFLTLQRRATLYYWRLCQVSFIALRNCLCPVVKPEFSNGKSAFLQICLHSCSDCISVTTIKCSDKTQFGEDRFISAHSSRLRSIIVRILRQGVQTASHIISTSRAERNEGVYVHWLAWAQLSFPTFLQFRTPCQENGADHSGWGLTTSINLRCHPAKTCHCQPNIYNSSWRLFLLPGDFRQWLCSCKQQGENW